MSVGVCFNIHNPPPYTHYGGKNLCVTHLQANSSSLSCVVTFSTFVRTLHKKLEMVPGRKCQRIRKL